MVLLGGNHTHRTDWFSLYPFAEHIIDAYVGKGDTIIGDGAWIGIRAMIMPKSPMAKARLSLPGRS